jgi:nitrite reductase (NADH) small subunit
MMPDTTASRNLGPLDQIPPGEGRAFHVGDERIAIFRTRAGELFALAADCSHRGGPLADGLVGGGQVVCPLHGYAFDLATGEAASHTCPAVRTYRVWLSSAGDLLVDLHGSTVAAGQGAATSGGG